MSPIAYLTSGKFWLNNHAHIMKMKMGLNKFLPQILELQNYEKYNTGIAQPKLNGDIIKHIIRMFPSVKEQHIIDSFFSSLDDLISSYQEKITQIENLKNLLKDMFM